MKHILVILLSTMILLTGCASTAPFDAAEVDKSLLPQHVIGGLETARGKTVLWGGIILDTRNLADATQIEVLAYPLDHNDVPLPDNRPLGRFLISHEGFLEPASYAQGRKLTVLGKVDDLQQGKVGESVYHYPVIQAEQLQLWPEQSGNKTRFHFGIGIVL